MAEGNYFTIKEFILTGLTEKTGLQLPLFFFFLGIYVVTVLGNLGMVVVILFSPHLHHPMYFFLSHLSSVDLCQSSVITPKMLENFVMDKIVISYAGCMAQFYLFDVFAVSECHMLAAMAHDRYVDICNHLLYVTMSYKVCSWMVVGLYSVGLPCAIDETLFCKANDINHYFSLSFSSFNIIFPALIILVSYFFIIASILGIPSTEGRSKAFSTCSSHILAVALFFGSLAFMYH
uniref:Olfactory receptor family 8 subfamily G member 36 n=1 Tax=Cricetulus griseus TaxID=10029 RepID=A0A8C2MBB8_CRIGR